jgi:hypothetical protein
MTPLPGRQQVTLEAPGQVTAVLQRELDLLELPGPAEQLQMPSLSVDTVFWPTFRPTSSNATTV